MGTNAEPPGVVSEIRKRLASLNLHVDATYVGPRHGNSGDDVIGPLMGVSNMGGFRYLGSLAAMKMLVLSTGKPDRLWPDGLNRETGIFTYFGDNRSPGRALHETPRHGNQILRTIFEQASAGISGRAKVPPIFVFEATGTWRDVVFAGVAIPATESGEGDDLVALWRTDHGKRFQNYRSRFSVINAPSVSRAWIEDISSGNPHSSNAPAAWLGWVRSGRIHTLKAPAASPHRTRSEQLPASASGNSLLAVIRQRFATNPFDFEIVAAALVRLHLSGVTSLDLTQPYRDGGRDGIGQLRLGVGFSSILVDFAIEAKCYSASRGVGVRELSRLISRLRHRQFGVLVTTSYLSTQAYAEVVDDGHPIVIVSGIDVVTILMNHGVDSVSSLDAWLKGVLSATEPLADASLRRFRT